ncbi:MAG TPA: DNA polymerase IV, partial [Clostridiales bacterium]|nr:DNA polymerase IV [Clostridiales bacterium]
IEPFGLDESWLDVSGSGNIGSGVFIAEEIRRRVKFELGITVSVGVSFNKIFAKLGSDYRKPDAVTVFDRENFRRLVWPLPACELLYVGPATSKKLRSCGIDTIGDIAAAPPDYLHLLFGKMGYVLFRFANGLDNEPVAPAGSAPVIKSIGNSSTAPRDLENDGDVKIMMMVLAESVGRRMREQGFRCSTVSISFRDNLLNGTVRQRKLERFTSDSDEIARAGMELFRGSWDWHLPLRSVGISCSGFEHESGPFQLDLFDDGERRLRRERLEKTVDSLKARFGNACIQRAALLGDKKLSGFNPYNDHVIHPVAYFKP